MQPKTKQESEIYSQMLTMLKDQFYHQSGDNITINRMVLNDMLTKQTMHGIELGKNAACDYVDGAVSLLSNIPNNLIDTETGNHSGVYTKEVIKILEDARKANY